jgi:hypothetical protein
VTCRSVIYSKASIMVLAKVWEASGYLCSQRLKAALPQWLPWIKKHFEVNARLQKDLLTISAVRWIGGFHCTNITPNGACTAPLGQARFLNI